MYFYQLKEYENNITLIWIRCLRAFTGQTQDRQLFSIVEKYLLHQFHILQ